MTAAEFLAEAATLLRERAKAAPPPPWHVLRATGDVVDHNGVHLGHTDYPAWRFASVVHPGVALALADWLDEAGGEWSGTRGVDDRALAVAAAILGRTWV